MYCSVRHLANGRLLRPTLKHIRPMSHVAPVSSSSVKFNDMSHCWPSMMEHQELFARCNGYMDDHRESMTRASKILASASLPNPGGEHNNFTPAPWVVFTENGIEPDHKMEQHMMDMRKMEFDSLVKENEEQDRVALSSVLKKRRKKMNKHKLKKRRKLNRNRKRKN